MGDFRIILAFLWVAAMLIYLFGDVLRIFAGDFTPGEIEGKKILFEYVPRSGSSHGDAYYYDCFNLDI
jgi:hypothetical protein